MSEVLKRVPQPPRVDRCDRHVVALDQNADRIVTGRDLPSNRRCRANSLVKGHQHGCETSTLSEQNCSINPRMTSLAMSSGYRRKSIQSSCTLHLGTIDHYIKVLTGKSYVKVASFKKIKTEHDTDNYSCQIEYQPRDR